MLRFMFSAYIYCMIRILIFGIALIGLIYLVFLFFEYIKYRRSLFFRLDQDVEKLNEELDKYKLQSKSLEVKKEDLYLSFGAIKNPPKDVKELFSLRNAVLDKEMSLYKKIIKLYQQYIDALHDKKQVLKFKAKHGTDEDAAEEISDALFKVKHMRGEIKTNLKISYYDQISGSNEVTDLRGSLKHLEEMDERNPLEEETSEVLENDIHDDFLVLKELVRKKV